MVMDAFLMTPLQIGDLIPRGTRSAIFSEIYWVFLILGTIVGIVVIAYMLYNGYKYRDSPDRADDGDERPQLGEIPSGGGGGKKLFLSFSLSAIIVISLVIWTYGTLLYVETAPAQTQDSLTVEVEGYQFGWDFTYPNGKNTSNELRIPRDRLVNFEVTSSDVFHNFAIPELRARTDAIPGQTTETWVRATETGTFEAQCVELCGAGHSYMNADVIVMEQGEFQDWLTANESSAQ